MHAIHYADVHNLLKRYFRASDPLGTMHNARKLDEKGLGEDLIETKSIQISSEVSREIKMRDAKLMCNRMLRSKEIDIRHQQIERAGL